MDFVMCGYENEPPLTDMSISPSQVAKELTSGSALWQALECIHFKLRFSGITRLLTHQIVRQRIGITFSQQCSGEVDWRHHDMLWPRNINVNVAVYSMGSKNAYARQVDAQVPLQEARFLLPHCLETFIYADCTLATILNFVSRRCCTMTNSWEMVTLAERLKNAVCLKIPEFKDIFRNPCEHQQCLYFKAKPSDGIVFPWLPDVVHAVKPNPEPLYNVTHAEGSCGYPVVKDEYWIGMETVKKGEYDADCP